MVAVGLLAHHHGLTRYCTTSWIGPLPARGEHSEHSKDDEMILQRIYFAVYSELHHFLRVSADKCFFCHPSLACRSRDTRGGETWKSLLWFQCMKRENLSPFTKDFRALEQFMRNISLFVNSHLCGLIVFRFVTLTISCALEPCATFRHKRASVTCPISERGSYI